MPEHRESSVDDVLGNVLLLIMQLQDDRDRYRLGAPMPDQPIRHSGVDLIAAERARQVTSEGWTPEHDDTHDNGEMVQAARGYLGSPGATWDRPTGTPFGATPMNWPWDPKWFKPTGDAVRDLVKAGALIAAEIDRLQRAENS